MKKKDNNFLLIIILLLILVISFIVIYLFNFNNKHTNNNNYQGGSVKGVSEDKQLSCMDTPIKEDELPDNIKDIIQEIKDYYNNDEEYFAFKYIDINTGFSLGINEKDPVFSASTIKAPLAIYYWEKASTAEINLNEKLTYLDKFYDDGCGIVKDSPSGSQYSIKDLLNYSIRISDNSAYLMLVNKVGRKPLEEFWKEKGADMLYTKSTWGDITAHDAGIYLTELYDFYNKDKEYGSLMMEDFLNTSKQFITAPDGIKVANKAGWYHETKHDAGIVFDEHPYIIVILSNLGSQYNGPYFKDISELTYKLHTEYWNYKNSICNN